MHTRQVAATVAALAAVGGIAGITGAGASSDISTRGTQALSIALLLPESKTARYESQDRPLFQRMVRRLCSNCRIVYSNAGQDAARQQNQADAALTQGVDVMVLDPVDSRSAAVIVNKAVQQKVPVISYDRLLLNSRPSYYISFDNQRVGRLQAQSLISRLRSLGKRSGNIVMINGAPTDNNASLFKRGAHSVFDRSSYKVAREYDTPDWSPDQAQNEMQQAITALGNNGFVGVYAANDGTAGGAIAAMKQAGVRPSNRPVTGQDAELAAIQRIIAGEQYMTVYKAIKPEAEAAARLAVALARGQRPPRGLVNSRTNNGEINVPSVIFRPVAVTSRNVKRTIVKDRYWTVRQICTRNYARACERAGLR